MVKDAANPIKCVIISNFALIIVLALISIIIYMRE